jgi:hypothetical protein
VCGFGALGCALAVRRSVIRQSSVPLVSGCFRATEAFGEEVDAGLIVGAFLVVAKRGKDAFVLVESVEKSLLCVKIKSGKPREYVHLYYNYASR